MKRYIFSLALGALLKGAWGQAISTVKLLEPIAANAVSGAPVALVDAAGCRYSGRVGHDDATRTQSTALVQPDAVWYVVVIEARCASSALLPGTVFPLPRPPSEEQPRGGLGYPTGTELALPRM